MKEPADWLNWGLGYTTPGLWRIDSQISGTTAISHFDHSPTIWESISHIRLRNGCRQDNSRGSIFNLSCNPRGSRCTKNATESGSQSPKNATTRQDPSRDFRVTQLEPNQTNDSPPILSKQTTSVTRSTSREQHTSPPSNQMITPSRCLPAQPALETAHLPF
jgi:hypothetical protein